MKKKNTRKWSLGLFLDWVFHRYGSMAVGCVCFSDFFILSIFGHREKIYGILLEKTEVTAQHSKSNDLKNL